MRLRLVRAVSFRAHHRLARPDRSEAENQARFGWTATPHAHHYRCEVTVTGPVDPTEPMVMSLPELDGILDLVVIGRLAGKHLDRDVPELRAVLPTCEALARDLFGQIEGRLPAGVRLERVMIAEDETLRAECLRDD